MDNKRKILHGNKAKIDEKQKITPTFSTLPLTSKKPTNLNISEINVQKSKEYVDENHK